MSTEDDLWRWQQHEERLNAIYVNKGGRAAWVYWCRHRLASFTGLSWHEWLCRRPETVPVIPEDGNRLEYLLTLHDSQLHWPRWLNWAKCGGIRTYGIPFKGCLAEQCCLNEMGLGVPDVALAPDDDGLTEPPTVWKDFFAQLGEDGADASDTS